MPEQSVYVEAWDPSYGSSARFDGESDSGGGEIVEDGGRLTIHDGVRVPEDTALAFVDGIRRTEGFLTFGDPVTGEPVRGLAGAFAVGAVVVHPGERAVYEDLATRRLAVLCAGQQVNIPAAPGGWRWETVSVDGHDIAAAESCLHEQMRQAETTLARRLGAEGALTVVDGNLSYVRSIDGTFIGCVKTHARQYLPVNQRARVADLRAGQRTSLFTVREDCYAAYVRLVDRGPHHAPWHGIIRIEVSQSVGLAAAVRLADQAAGTLPRFAGIEGHDARAPQNLRPVGALETRLRHLLGPADFALRALRVAVAAHHPAA